MASKRKALKKAQKKSAVKKESRQAKAHGRAASSTNAEGAPAKRRAVEIRVAPTQQVLLDNDCNQISEDCVKRITESNRPFSRATPLQEYGVNSDQQCVAIIDLVANDPTIGVPGRHFKIDDPSKLQGLSPGWTMGNLADTIQGSAVPL